MDVIAEALQKPRSGFMHHVYWEDLAESGRKVYNDPLDQDDTIETSCTLM